MPPRRCRAFLQGYRNENRREPTSALPSIRPDHCAELENKRDKPMRHSNDNEVLRYYEAEMRYLREAGKEFAQAFPERARMLNIDRIGDRDPHPCMFACGVIQ